MKNLYQSPGHQPVIRELEAELKRLEKELGDDPKDVGHRPRVGQALEERTSLESKIDGPPHDREPRRAG